MNFFKKYYTTYGALVVIVIAFLGGFYIGKAEREITVVNKKGEPIVSGEVEIRASDVKEHLGKDVDFDLFLSVWDHLRDRYVDQPVSETKLLYGALAGLVASLDDPYSVFLEPKISEEFAESLNGRFEGIGAEIALKNEILTVVAPLDGSPAEASGLLAQDRILEIDKISTKGMRLDEAVNRIRGEKGTTVVLRVHRKDEEELRDIPIIRDTIKVQSVTWEMKDDAIAYIHMRNFNTDTTSRFRQIQKDVLVKNPNAIIFDLRNNSGGFLQTAIDVASAWIDDKPIVRERSVAGIKTYSATLRPLLKDISTVVLVNGGSASASEIVTGSLQDYGLAYIIGEQTFGKGSVQVLEDLSDGSSLKFTIARWLTPNDRSIDEEGITPDEIIELTEEDFNNDADPQLDRALEYLRSRL
jgi:carboxyl-terminal processing protease